MPNGEYVTYIEKKFLVKPTSRPTSQGTLRVERNIFFSFIAISLRSQKLVHWLSYIFLVKIQKSWKVIAIYFFEENWSSKSTAGLFLNLKSIFDNSHPFQSDGALVFGDDTRSLAVTAANDASISAEAKIITHGGTVIHAQLLNKNKIIGAKQISGVHLSVSPSIRSFKLNSISSNWDFRNEFEQNSKQFARRHLLCEFSLFSSFL